MRPQKIQRPGDCLATAVAAMLDINALELPWTGGPWPEAWDAIRTALAERGWRLAFVEWNGPKGATLEELLAEEYDDPIEEALLWLVGVTHPSFVTDRSDEPEAHVLVLRGNEIAFDPGGDQALRPPSSELEITGIFTLMPVDPARFELRAA